MGPASRQGDLAGIFRFWPPTSRPGVGRRAHMAASETHIDPSVCPSTPADAALRQVTDPESLVVRFPASEPLRLDSGREIAPLTIAYKPTATQRGQVERHSDLPCADRRPARREQASGHRQGRLVGNHGRPRQAGRHRPLLRHLLQHPRRLHGLDRPGLENPARASPTASISRSSPSATWCARRRG